MLGSRAGLRPEVHLAWPLAYRMSLVSALLSLEDMVVVANQEDVGGWMLLG